MQGSSVSLIDALTQTCLECHDDAQEPLPLPPFLLLRGSDFDTGEKDSLRQGGAVVSGSAVWLLSGSEGLQTPLWVSGTGEATARGRGSTVTGGVGRTRVGLSACKMVTIAAVQS